MRPNYLSGLSLRFFPNAAGGMVQTQVTAQGCLGSTPEGRRPQIRGWRAGGALAVASATPATQLLSPARVATLNHAKFVCSVCSVSIRDFALRKSITAEVSRRKPGTPRSSSKSRARSRRAPRAPRMCLKRSQRTALSLYPRGSEHWPRACGLTAARATLAAAQHRQYVRLFWFSLAPDHGIQTSRCISGWLLKIIAWLH